jgi:hypothetical protein
MTALYINRERMKVNFDFWRTRARAEQTADCIAARKAIFDAELAFTKGDLIRARPEFEKGMQLWRKVLDDPEFHSLVDDPSLGGDLMDEIRRYQKCLDQDDLDLPRPFILQDVLDKHENRQGAMPMDAKPKPAGAKKDADKKDAGKKETEKKGADKKDNPGAAANPEPKPKQP